MKKKAKILICINIDKIYYVLILGYTDYYLDLVKQNTYYKTSY